MRIRSLLVVLPALLIGCEDGPDLIFEPNAGNPAEQNGHSGNDSWVQEGDKGFEDDVGGSDASGRARFCDEDETTALVQQMVVAPIIPDVSGGTVPLWDPDTGGQLHADKLVGRPEDGKFCDPTGVYLNAFTWGPTQEIIVFFDEETRFVESIAVTDQYLGTLEGTYTKDDATTGTVVFKTRDRIKIDGSELADYTSDAAQATKPNAWMNHDNVSKMYRMVRETFFGEAPLGDSFDCVAARLCDQIWEFDNQDTPQSTWIVMVDSGIQVGISPEGQLSFALVEPVRVAPFELDVDISFVDVSGAVVPTFTSNSKAGCTFTLTEGLTWAEFKNRCVTAQATLDRINYNVWSARDAVSVEFNGVDLAFLRDTVNNPVFEDGEEPAADDVLLDVFFSRSLNATLAEFQPNTLALEFATRLQAQLADWTDDAFAGHPFENYVITVPDTVAMPDDPQRIGELMYDTGGGVMKSWVTEVVSQVQDDFYALSALEQAAVDVRIIETVYLVHPFVDAVLNAVTNTISDDPSQCFKVLRTTDDKRWSIGYAHFRDVSGEAVRIIAQYSLNFGALTALEAARGSSEIDVIFDDIRTEMNTAHATNELYYGLGMARYSDNRYGLGAGPMVVLNFDRQLETLLVRLQKPDGVGGATNVMMTLPGEPMQDNNGFLRQIRGERYEWVPADIVRMYGKETSQTFYIDDTGAIARVAQGLFKGTVDLCPGLPIALGDDIRTKLNDWVANNPNGLSAFHDCEIVYNYSENGNILDEVVSLNYKVSFVTIDGRAVSVALWR